MLPWIGFALVALYSGYVAYETSQTRRRAREAPVDTSPDPVLELERINNEIDRLATSARMTLESAREAVRRGV